MRLLSFTLSVLLVFVAVRAVPSQPSGAPTCTYSCPQVDQSGASLGSQYDNGDVLFCSYPGIFASICDYSDSDGQLVGDNDTGFCPSTAVQSCNARRRSALKRAPAPPMVAPVARAPTPEMKVRAQLKRRRPVPAEA